MVSSTVFQYSRFSIIRIAVFHYNLNTAQISEIVWIANRPLILVYYITADMTDKRELLLYGRVSMILYLVSTFL